MDCGDYLRQVTDPSNGRGPTYTIQLRCSADRAVIGCLHALLRSTPAGVLFSRVLCELGGANIRTFDGTRACYDCRVYVYNLEPDSAPAGIGCWAGGYKAGAGVAPLFGAAHLGMRQSESLQRRRRCCGDVTPQVFSCVWQSLHAQFSSS